MPCSSARSPSVSRPTALIVRPIAVDDAPAIFSRDAQDPSVVRLLSWRPHQGLTVCGTVAHRNHSRLLEACHASGLGMPKVSVVSASVHVSTYLLADGRLITAISKLLADQHGLKILSVALPVRPSPILVATPKNRTLSPLVERFVEDVREVTKSFCHRQHARKSKATLSRV